VITQSIDETIPVTMTFTDGDGDTVSGSTTIHVTDGGTATTPNAVVQSAQVIQSQGLASSSLFSTNDNDAHRGPAAATNAAIIGALAAVGIEASHSVASAGEMEHVHHSADLANSAVAMADSPALDASFVSDVAGGSDAILAASIGGHGFDPASGHRAATAEFHGQLDSHARDAGHHAEAGHGTDDGSAHLASAAPSHAVAAATVAMPSAEQLEAIGATAHDASPSIAAEVAQHNQVVGKVLADSLNGGEGHGPSIDTLINGLPGHTGAMPDALQTLASHADAAVSFGHMGFGGAFGTDHVMLSMEMAMHDAAPAHG
jgi:hypothetical protein